MWWCDRRALLGALLALPACGFAPAYGPGGAGGVLQGRVALDEPDTSEGYAFTRRFEERLGRTGAAAPFVLSTVFDITQQDLGGTSAGTITRHRLRGTVDYTLRDGATDTERLSARTMAFTGYSTTGSTVATLAAERDARERLMVLLADQVVDDLLLRAQDLPPQDLPA